MKVDHVGLAKALREGTMGRGVVGTGGSPVGRLEVCRVGVRWPSVLSAVRLTWTMGEESASQGAYGGAGAVSAGAVEW